MIKFFRFNKIDKQLEKQRPRLYRLAHSWCGDSMLADDLVQDTLKKALEKQGQLKDFSRLEAWLFRILHNCWMEYLRVKKPTIDIDEIDYQLKETAEALLTEQQIIQRVRQAIAILPLTQRQVITLIDLEGSSYNEVSEILEIPLGTVMSRLNRARTLLKKRLISIKTIHVTKKYLRRVK